MDDKFRLKQKESLLGIKNQIINTGLLRSKEGLEISSEDLPDETDLANSVINQQIIFNMRTRELNKLRLIAAALSRIENGEYGYCEDCEEEIPKKRLEHQPWATLCIFHAEEKERKEVHYVKHG
jgi:DnaK suppressor protein